MPTKFRLKGPLIGANESGQRMRQLIENFGYLPLVFRDKLYDIAGWV